MPVVRCPDCFREISHSQEDLSKIIECSVCDARFGPFIVAAPHSQPPSAPSRPAAESPTVLEEPDTTVDADPSKPRVRRKRVKPKSGTRFLPIIFGIFLGLGGSAALIGAIYVLIKTQLSGNPGH